MTLNGAEIIVGLLEQAGITSLAGIPGGSNLPIYAALSHSRIRHVLARHEQGAAFIAQGQARASGRTAVCLATAGPGAANLLTGLADAWMDSVPVIAITGQVPQALIGTQAFQEVDICAMARPVTKRCFLIRHPRELLTVIPSAFELAAAGRPGPVLIDVPKDVQLAEWEFDQWPVICPDAPGDDRLGGSDSARIREIASWINQSERPILYVGGGAMNSPGRSRITDLAEAAAIPVVKTLMGIGALAHDHPCYLGMLGMHGPAHVNQLLDRCDLLIALGARFDDRATGKVAEFCPSARIIHIDIDPAQINKIKSGCLGLTADLNTALREIMPLLRRRRRGHWWREISAARQEPDGQPADGGMARLLRQLAQRVPADTIVTTDVGQHQMWTAQYYPFHQPRTFLTSGGLGTMGFGLPAAIGAALACPGRRVLCISGDGSIMMNLQELATLRELDLDVKVVIVNNQSLGLVRQQQELFYNRDYFGSVFAVNPDLVAIASGFGIPGYEILDPEIAGDGLEAALALPGPALVNIRLDQSANVWPMVAPGGANREMLRGEKKAVSGKL